ncbi:hypothetical protein SAMN00768000_0206 [Sulfobacillus thermosulfidooxidans DSM 9293]|uniref:Uncharacterized protein n=1 Tax=Sulfobacillus thermosulfidooxidans (strain DSM 9293 / VKM B-1269 / AT-1) TaxID=929705 RepID=A0A1W1W6V7_SULTA|nr:hypothetical protein [Sulfobacillus thermosulfidooxidans]SMC01995.1 hypothetical protein SAMN00768000_0206 [Sulfobacillus thermosulfidooxidans DSM 9293]
MKCFDNYEDGDDEHVAEALGCPTCQETRFACLDWRDPGDPPFPHYPQEYVVCVTCGTAYDPNHENFVIGRSG